MSRRARDLSDGGLEAALRSVARDLEYPPTPALAPGVLRRIEKAPGPRRVRMPMRWPRARSALAVLGTLIFGSVAALTFSPQAREAVADFLGVGGIRIGFGEKAPSTPGDLELGGPVSSLAEAEGRVDFDVKVPRLPGLPAPEIYFSRPPDSGMVSLLYRDAYEGVDEPDLLITQFRADIDDGFIKKIAFGEADVESVAVGDVFGYWIRGTHSFTYIDGSGTQREETLRLAANVLLWEDEGVTYRIEGGFERSEALRIAGSLAE